MAFSLSAFIIEVGEFDKVPVLRTCVKRVICLLKWYNCELIFITVFSSLAEIIYDFTNDFYMKWHIIMPSPASQVFNLLAFKNNI